MRILFAVWKCSTSSFVIIKQFHVLQDVLIWVWTLHKGFRRALGHPIQMKSTLTMYTPFFPTFHKSHFFLFDENVSEPHIYFICHIRLNSRDNIQRKKM